MKSTPFMQKYISFFKYILVLICLCSLLLCSVTNDNDELYDSSSELTFSVLNVGQALSQIGKKDEQAVVWDIGDNNDFTLWQDGYSKLGSPYIKAIVISHGDMDHKGGLQFLSGSTAFDGLIVASPYEDTASLRALIHPDWTSPVRFKIVKQDDTLALLDNVLIECIWPPYSAQNNDWVENNFTKNRFSLCFKITYNNTSVLVTGDIDSIAEIKLSDTYEFNLFSDIVVVPHHGSRGSLLSRFYGYVNPDLAIISCGLNNQYGHPADDVVKFLAFQMGVTLCDTRYMGHVTNRSNGEYWVR